MRKSFLAATILLLVVSALSAAALAADGLDLSWWLIGGGSAVSAGAISLGGGVGQGVAGEVESGQTGMCSGFWCAPPGQQVHLPVVLK
jgi:hypothetical protein